MSTSPQHKSLRGMPDVLPQEAQLIRWVEGKAEEVFSTFGYGEIRTPLLEETKVFTRSIGENTDIVEKEMYSFKDRGDKDISLRPEGTASVIRAYIEHGFGNTPDMVKLYYTGPMFRGERPQKGRLRQFRQIGAEIIRGKAPYADAELLLSLNVLFEKLGVKGFTLLINSLGCSTDRTKYKKDLSDFLSKNSSSLCEDCVRRAKTNVLRVLDCKSQKCKATVQKAPSVTDYLCETCENDYSTLKSILKKIKVPFEEKKDLVRGLDYYTGIIFEAIHPALGSQDAIAAGGRYDNLTKQMGGPEVEATGYAIGVERLLLAVDPENVKKENQDVLVVAVGEEAKEEAFGIAAKLWTEGIKCEIDHTGRSMKGQMRKAHKDGRKFVVMLGSDEMKKKKLLLKNMDSSEQDVVTLAEAIKEIKKETKC